MNNRRQKYVPVEEKLAADIGVEALSREMLLGREWNKLRRGPQAKFFCT